MSCQTPAPPDAGNVPDAGAPSLLRVVAVGDTGKGNAGQQEVADAIAAWCAARPCDLVLLLGDNIYDSGVSSPTDPDFQSLFELPYAAINLPFYVVLGNHDYGGGGLGTEFGKGQHQVDYTAHSTKWKMPAKYYRFKKGQVEFFGLDTNSQMFGQDGQQKTDVKSWLTSSDATWKVVFGHHPYRSNGNHGNAGSYDNLPFVPITNGKGVKDFMEAVVCGRADLYVSGHDHSRQWITATCQGTELAVSGAGATGTNLNGSNPTRFQSTALGFLDLTFEDRTLTARFVNTAGGVDSTRILTK